MSKQQMSEASRYLRTLADHIVQPYIASAKPQAILLTGSTALGIADFYSDIDMGIYYYELPSEEELMTAMQQNQGTQRQLIGERDEQGFAESYKVRGVECQIAHTTIHGWEQTVATVFEHLDVASPLQKVLSGVLEGIPLYGNDLLQQWKAQLENYPDTLAIAMVNHYLAFFPIWGLHHRLVARDALLWQYATVVETEQHILGVLAGINRLYYSTFQFKRMHQFIAQMKYTPDNLATRLERLFQTEPVTALLLMKDLVQETVTLVEQHLPQIDTTKIREYLAWQEQPWKPE